MGVTTDRDSQHSQQYDEFIKKEGQREEPLQKEGDKAEEEDKKAKKSGQVPFMITRQMKLDLISLGYSMEEIRGMRPEEAHSILTE